MANKGNKPKGKGTAKGKPQGKPDWAEAKRLCRLNQDDIRMAKELGMAPKSLIKNRPSPEQRWKAPVKDWIRALYAKKFPDKIGDPVLFALGEDAEARKRERSGRPRSRRMQPNPPPENDAYQPPIDNDPEPFDIAAWDEYDQDAGQRDR